MIDGAGARGARLWLAGIAWQGAVVLGAGLAMSSTAIVLPMLARARAADRRAGRDAFAVLLFQDLAFIPLVALVPLLARADALPDHVPWHDVARAAVAIAVILIGGAFPAAAAVPRRRRREDARGVHHGRAADRRRHRAARQLSRACRPRSAPSWPACCCRNREYRHELQADIEPFEGLLLGFFFISVGMSADLGLAHRRSPALLAAAPSALLAVKTAIAFALARIARQRTRRPRCASASPCRRPASSASCCSAPRSPPARSAQAMPALATLVTAASMVATPMLFAGVESDSLAPEASRRHAAVRHDRRRRRRR